MKKFVMTSVVFAAVVLAGTGKVCTLAAGSPSAAYPTPANYRDFRYYAT